MNSNDAEKIARIHQQALPDTFLSSLGLSFLTEMYSALADDFKSIIFIAEEKKIILGFVSGILDSNTFIKRVLLHSPLKLGCKISWQILKNPYIIGKLLQTLRYGPMCFVENVDTELLAIAVIPEVQRSGLGSTLFTSLLEELQQRKVKKLKVLVGQELISAQNFYKKNNFIWQRTIELYGKKKDILVKELTPKQ
jgi:ribosomal protein S18 acetylase RimI-like enzyme